MLYCSSSKHSFLNIIFKKVKIQGEGGFEILDQFSYFIKMIFIKPLNDIEQLLSFF